MAPLLPTSRRPPSPHLGFCAPLVKPVSTVPANTSAPTPPPAPAIPRHNPAPSPPKPHARSTDYAPAAPSLQKSSEPPPHPAHFPPAHKPFPSARRPPRPPAITARPPLPPLRTKPASRCSKC